MLIAGSRLIFLMGSFLFLFPHVGFTSNQYENFGLIEDDTLPILGESGFSILTEHKMQEVGYPYDFNSVRYQIAAQTEFGYLDRDQKIYDNFHCLITIIYNEYRNRTGFEHVNEEMPESTLGSETGGSYFTNNILTLEGQVAKDISDFYPGNINTFKDAENEVIRPLIQFLYEKQKQLCFGNEAMVESLSASSLQTLEIYEKAVDIGMQEMRYQAYSVWYLLMVRSMIEDQIQNTITQCNERLNSIEILREVQPTIEEKITQAVNTSLETKSYEKTLKTIEEDIEIKQSEVESIKDNLRSDVEMFLKYLRAPQDPRFRTGYVTGHGIVSNLCIGVGWSEHPRVLGNKTYIYPLLNPEDVQWGFDRLVEGLEEQWEILNNENDLEIPLPQPLF